MILLLLTILFLYVNITDCQIKNDLKNFSYLGVLENYHLINHHNKYNLPWAIRTTEIKEQNMLSRLEKNKNNNNKAKT